MEEKDKPAKPKRKLTLKQAKLAKAVQVAPTLTEAAQVAGYASPGSAHRALQVVKMKLADVARANGLDEARVVKKCASLMEAKKTEFAQYEGRFTDERQVDALDIQLRATQFGGAILGMKNGNGNGDNGGLPQVVVHLGFLGPGRAEAVLAIQPAGGTAGGPADLVAEAHEDAG